MPIFPALLCNKVQLKQAVMHFAKLAKLAFIEWHRDILENKKTIVDLLYILMHDAKNIFQSVHRKLYTQLYFASCYFTAKKDQINFKNVNQEGFKWNYRVSASFESSLAKGCASDLTDVPSVIVLLYNVIILATNTYEIESWCTALAHMKLPQWCTCYKTFALCKDNTCWV